MTVVGGTAVFPANLFFVYIHGPRHPPMQAHDGGGRDSSPDHPHKNQPTPTSVCPACAAKCSAVRPLASLYCRSTVPSSCRSECRARSRRTQASRRSGWLAAAASISSESTARASSAALPWLSLSMAIALLSLLGSWLLLLLGAGLVVSCGVLASGRILSIYVSPAAHAAWRRHEASRLVGWIGIRKSLW